MREHKLSNYLEDNEFFYRLDSSSQIKKVIRFCQRIRFNKPSAKCHPCSKPVNSILSGVLFSPYKWLAVVNQKSAVYICRVNPFFEKHLAVILNVFRLKHGPSHPHT